jgi:O-antigen/teichoic acid export membrane protein
MAGLKKNIVASYLGQAWVAFMGIAFLPFYIKILGVEAYGLIGVFSLIQAWLVLLDMGITPTLNREMARFTAGSYSAQGINDLLRSLELICIGIAVAIAGAIYLASGWVARDWLVADKLPLETVANALSMMAFIVALRFVEGIYRASLFGLQRQVWYNVANSLLATARQVALFAVLALLSPTIQAFFLCQIVFSLLTVVVFAWQVRRVMPTPPVRPHFSWAAIEPVWRFASGMLGITLLALLLTQVDKLVLSKLLSLEHFGYYTLAGTVATVIYMVIGPVTQAVYPRMVELTTRGEAGTLVRIYHQTSQLITTLTAPAAALLFFYAPGVVFMWSGNVSLAENTGPILAVLAFGTFLNGLMYAPYHLQLAHGWTTLTLRSNVVAVVVIIPAIFWVVPRYGAVGAAWIWVCLNLTYILVVLQFMHRRILSDEKWAWLVRDVAIPLAGTTAVCILMYALRPSGYENRVGWFFFLLLTGGLSTLMTVLLSPSVRSLAISTFRQILPGAGPKQP